MDVEELGQSFVYFLIVFFVGLESVAQFRQQLAHPNVFLFFELLFFLLFFFYGVFKSKARHLHILLDDRQDDSGDIWMISFVPLPCHGMALLVWSLLVGRSVHYKHK